VLQRAELASYTFSGRGPAARICSGSTGGLLAAGHILISVAASLGGMFLGLFAVRHLA
jgi:hypothetical protein